MNCKKIVAFILLVMLVMTSYITAFADTSSVKMGETKYKTYNNLTSAPTYRVTIVGQPYQQLSVKLSFWDKETEDALIKKYDTWANVPKDKKNTPWKKSNLKTVTFTLNNQKSYIINMSAGKDFGFKKGRTTKARLSFTAKKTDKTKLGYNDPIKVTYPD